MKFFKKDVSEKKEFTRNGYKYRQVLADDEKHVYLYEMTSTKLEMYYPHYELIKAKKSRQPDGTYVYTYPCDEDFGSLGWFLYGKVELVQKNLDEMWEDMTGKPTNFKVTEYWSEK